MKNNEPEIVNWASHRRFLLDTMQACREGKVSVAMANSISSLSAEVHKSLSHEWECAVYAAEHLTQAQRRRLGLLTSDDDNEDDGVQIDEPKPRRRRR